MEPSSRLGCAGPVAAEGNDSFQGAIVLGKSIVGVIGYVSVDWRNARPHRLLVGRGIPGPGTMTAAARTLVDHALTVWQLNRIEIRVATENRRSRAIPERLGFSQEGTLHEAELIDGRYLDSVIYSMLAADWPSRMTVAFSAPARD
jgi:ribosomal-protein-serine acetyltransferase